MGREVGEVLDVRQYFFRQIRLFAVTLSSINLAWHLGTVVRPNRLDSARLVFLLRFASSVSQSSLTALGECDAADAEVTGRRRRQFVTSETLTPRPEHQW